VWGLEVATDYVGKALSHGRGAFLPEVNGCDSPVRRVLSGHRVVSTAFIGRV
jgi:hypothetical protein